MSNGSLVSFYISILGDVDGLGEEVCTLSITTNKLIDGRWLSMYTYVYFVNSDVSFSLFISLDRNVLRRHSFNMYDVVIFKCACVCFF